MNADVGIIGGGPAGLSSLLWCNSLGMEAILFEGSSELGGQMPRMYHPIIDYPGLLPRDGRELRDRFVEQIDRLNLLQRCLFREQAVEVRRSGTTITIRTTTQTHTLKAVVLAMGVRVRRLEIPGELEFERKGVSFSATRDHPLVAGKTSVVVGGGDSAVENSLILARVCKHVYLVHRSDSFRARAEWLSEARSNPVITIIPNAHLTSIHGDSSITQ